MTQQNNTLGMKRVRIEFNPSTSSAVGVIKVVCGSGIDVMDKVTADCDIGEVKRLVALGHTAMEQAAMWYVKALTSEGFVLPVINQEVAEDADQQEQAEDFQGSEAQGTEGPGELGDADDEPSGC